MRFYQETQLRDGTPCILRSPEPSDAAAILAHMEKTSGETDYMLRYPDEVTRGVEAEKSYLRELLESPRHLMIAAEIDGRIVSNAGLNPVGAREKIRHRASFGISVQRAYWGCGVGTLTLRALLAKAREMGYTQVELDVVSENARAIALYEKLGFVRTGVIPNAFHMRDGRALSLDYMVLALK